MSEGSDKNRRLLEPGVITLTGGRDVHKNLILTIPTDKLTALEEWSVQDLVALFMCQASVSKYLQTSEDGSMALACVSDLRVASSSAIRQLVDTLEAVEHHQRGTVCAVYFLKPRNKAKSHALKKMLGVKPSKKNPKVPLFKVALLKTVQELHAHVEVSQLTLDFYGTLQYNHLAWMRLYEVVITCIRSGQHLLSKLPSVRDRAELLQDYDTENHTAAQLQQLLTDLTEKFQLTLAESGLPARLQETKQTLFSLEQPGVEEDLPSALPLLCEGVRCHLRGLYTRLASHSTELEEGWRAVESKLIMLTRVQRHRERAREIEHKICQHYQPLLQEHPIVGRTLSQAELYRAHFTTTLHEPAKELLSQATEILEAVQRLKMSDSLQSVSTALSRRRGSVAPAELGTLDMSDITRCLTTSIQPFAGQLQQLQQIYVNVHIFHLLFEKALSWYKKVLKFLPESLVERCASNSGLRPSDVLAYSESPHAKEILLFMPADWLGAVRVFLSRHPPPRQEHLERLDESIPQVVDKRLRAQARSLALRLRLLQRLLSSTRLPMRLLQAVVAWKSELFGSAASQERPSSAQPAGAGSPQRERQRGVHFSSQPGRTEHHLLAEDEVKVQAVRHGHYRSPTAGDSMGVSGHSKVSRSRRGAPAGDHESFLAAHGSPYQGAEAGSGPEHGRLHERGHASQHRRSVSARSMLRSRSVDFNFNSSSTDGSVFDYDKAVLGLREGHGSSNVLLGDHGESMGQRQHGSNRKQQEREVSGHLPHISDRAGYGVYSGEERVSLDPSHHTLPSGTRNRLRYVLAERRDDFTGGPDKGQAYTLPARGQQARHVSASSSERDPAMFSEQPVRSHQARQVQSSDSSSYERFIRINLSPRKTSSQTSREEFGYASDVDRFGPMSLQVGGREEEESGFDTAEGDPYDSIVTKIREISSSNYTSAEKLQKVSELISKSQRGHEKRGDREQNLKSAKSTMDLTGVGDLNTRNERIQAGGDEHASSDVAQSSPKEKPVKVIQRMKQNLAKSMDDLSSVPAGYETNVSRRNANDRFQSELRIDPVFSQPSRSMEATVVRSAGFMQSFSDVETSKSSPLLTSPGDVGSRTRTISDADISARHPFADDEWSHVADGDGEGSASSRAPRPASLALPSARNFISPSFLRPAASMQDLSSRPLTAANLGLLQELEAETDLQVLKDMEMLHALQEEPFVRMQQYKETPGNWDTDRASGNERHVQHKDGKDRKEAAATEQKNVGEPAATTDVIANFVFYNSGARMAYTEGHIGAGRTTGYTTSSSNSSPSWLQGPPASGSAILKHRGSSSAGEEEEEAKAGPGGVVSQTKEHLKRLSHEADQEYLSQEDVAQSLKNTQLILEVEENRQRRIRELLSGRPSLEEEGPEGEQAGAAQAASTSASVDNGYSSWASRLVSALSTSSEGGEASARAPGPHAWRLDNDWRESTSEDKYRYSNSSQET